MVSNGVLIQILESCIEQFAEEWLERSDDYFWWEADIASKLQSLLWAYPEMWHTWGEQINGTTRQRKVPLVHRRAPATNGQRYDLALYEPHVAERMVTMHLIPGIYPGRAKYEPVLAAVEIAQAHSALRANSKRDIKDAFTRLVDNIDQIDHGYLLIPVTTYSGDKKSYCGLSLLQKVQEWIIESWQELYTEASRDKVKAYWVSDHRDDTARRII
jgi:hypothetical protein